jgi:hypothetical protein
MGRNPSISGEGYRFEPKFTLLTSNPDMYVGWLIWFVRIEVKTIRTDA